MGMAQGPIQGPSNIQSVIAPTGNVVSQAGLTFREGGLQLGQSIGLPLHFHKNVLELQGLIPLTVFDPK